MLPNEPTTPRWRVCPITGLRRFSDHPNVVVTHDPAKVIPYCLLWTEGGKTHEKPFAHRRSLMRAYEVTKERLNKC